jgi:hypothetical protein
MGKASHAAEERVENKDETSERPVSIFEEPQVRGGCLVLNHFNKDPMRRLPLRGLKKSVVAKSTNLLSAFGRLHQGRRWRRSLRRRTRATLLLILKLRLV